LMNKATSKQCEACSIQVAQPKGRWRCCSCAAFNPQDSAKCLACSKSRSHSSRGCVRCLQVFMTDSLNYCYNCLTMVTPSTPCTCPRPMSVHLCSGCALGVRTCLRCRRVSWGLGDRCYRCVG
jgi:hypothetical protein